jgi:hypothetical protein
VDSTFDTICAAIDRGDRLATLALADVLEEHDDWRVSGLRQMIRQGSWPNGVTGPRQGGFLGWGWQPGFGHEWNLGDLSKDEKCLVCFSNAEQNYGSWYIYPRISEAVLSFAAATTVRMQQCGS